VDAAKIEAQVTELERNCHKLESGLIPNAMVPALSSLVLEWKGVATVAAGLQRPEMKPRHWTQVEELLGCVIAKSNEFTVEGACKLGILTHKDRCAR
jgi:hypothetical protein